MATLSSASGPGTKLQLTLTGQGADPNSMPSTPISSSQTSTPDTGFFTISDSNSATPFMIGGAICALAVLSVILLKLKKSNHLSVRHGFKIRDQKLLLRRFGIFAGSFLFAFLGASLIAPNFLKPNESASALEATNAIAITTGSSQSGNVLNMTKSLSSTPTMASASEIVSVTNSTTRGYTLYLSTATASNNLNYNEDATKGYIAPTSGTITAKKSLELNRWGFAVGATEAQVDSNSTVFSAVPAVGNEVAVKKTTSATSAGDQTTILYGAYINNTIPAGDYYNTILYTAIVNL